MTAPPVSIVIVSRDRPKALKRCLTGVSQLLYDPFEVVIVADPAACEMLGQMPQGAQIKLIAFDQANISAARNLGIRAAAGQVIAFIDDDSVPEPTWLSYLTAPFSQPQVAAVGGFVRARNGISWQNRARSVDDTGTTAPLDVDANYPTVLTPADGLAIKIEGTNMAVRRSVLVKLGGFDPRFQFFLDETDLNLRLAAAGHCTAIAPRAEVHHGYAASARRRGDRVPTDLYQIGASWAVFLGKHCSADRRETAWKRIQRGERRRALTHLIAGSLEPRDVPRLMRSLLDGYQQGLTRVAMPLPVLAPPDAAFRAFARPKNPGSVLISGRFWSRRRLRRQARQQVEAGNITTLIHLSPSAVFHRVAFQDEGFWEQTGGLFGKSDRTHRLFRPWSFARRIQFEVKRVGIVRDLD